MLLLLRIFDLVCDPVWLAVVLAFLANYEQIQEGTLSLWRDLREILSEIRDLLARHMHWLITTGRKVLARLADQLGKEVPKWARRFGRAADALRGNSDG